MHAMATPASHSKVAMAQVGRGMHTAAQPRAAKTLLPRTMAAACMSRFGRKLPQFFFIFFSDIYIYFLKMQCPMLSNMPEMMNSPNANTL